MAPARSIPRMAVIWLTLSLSLPGPAYAMREISTAEKDPQTLAGLEETLRSGDPGAVVKTVASRLAQLVGPVAPSRALSPAAGMEEPKPPERPLDFGQFEYLPARIGGRGGHRLRAEDRVHPGQIEYESWPGRRTLPPGAVHTGTEIHVRRIQNLPIPLKVLGRFAIGALTFRIVPLGPDQIIRPPAEESEGGVAVAPMAKRYRLQIWLNGTWEGNDLDIVHLEDGVPVVIGREHLPRDPDPVTQFDLEGKVGTPVSDERYRSVFDGWYLKRLSEPEWRIAVS